MHTLAVSHYDRISTRLDNFWMMAPAHRVIAVYEMSLKKYPNIKPGEEFKGYDRSLVAA